MVSFQKAFLPPAQCFRAPGFWPTTMWSSEYFNSPLRFQASASEAVHHSTAGRFSRNHWTAQSSLDKSLKKTCASVTLYARFVRVKTIVIHFWDVCIWKSILKRLLSRVEGYTSADGPPHAFGPGAFVLAPKAEKTADAGFQMSRICRKEANLAAVLDEHPALSSRILDCITYRYTYVYRHTYICSSTHKGQNPHVGV